MPMTRQERIATHKKQERLIIKRGLPSVGDLKDGVPTIRSTSRGLVEFIKHKGILHEKVLDRTS